jgi:hypothetical protein
VAGLTDLVKAAPGSQVVATYGGKPRVSFAFG